MSDYKGSLLISRQDAINALPSAQKKGHWIDEETNYLCSECRRGCWVNSDYCPWCGADMRGEQDAVKAIESCEPGEERFVITSLPSAQQWIPCSERLPEEEGYYLTTTMYQKVYCDYWNGDNFDRTEMVVAWMSLPEPWRRES